MQELEHSAFTFGISAWLFRSRICSGTVLWTGDDDSLPCFRFPARDAYIKMDDMERVATGTVPVLRSSIALRVVAGMDDASPIKAKAYLQTHACLLEGNLAIKRDCLSLPVFAVGLLSSVNLKGEDQTSEDGKNTGISLIDVDRELAIIACDRNRL